MRLGQLARLTKTAQEGAPQQGAPASLVGMFEQLNHQRMQGGEYGSQLTPGFAGRQAPQSTGGQLGVQMLQSLFGEMGAGLGGLALPILAPLVKQQFGIDLMAPIQTGYGGDPGASREAFAATQAMMAAQLSSRRDLVVHLSQELGERLESMGILSQLGMTKDSIADMVEGMDPQTFGSMFQQVAAALPEVTTVLTQLDPSFIADFTPFATQAMLQNGGKFDNRLFQRDVQDFKQAFAAGQFGRVPAQLAAHSVAFAAETFGPQATIAHAANAAQVADQFVRAGLAGTFGGAMALAKQVDPTGRFITDPQQITNYVQYLSTMSQKGMVNPQQIAQGAELAAKEGISPAMAMSIIARSGNLRTELGSAVADKFTSDAAKAYAGLQQTGQVDALARAYQNDRHARQSIDRAMQQGDMGRLTRLANQAARNPRLQGMKADTSSFMNRLSVTNPNLLEGMMAQQIEGGMRSLPASVRSRLSRVLADKQRLGEAVATSDYTGIRDPRVRQLLQNRPDLVAAALSVDQSALRRGSRFRAARRVGRPDMQPVQPELPHLGFGTPGFEAREALPRTPDEPSKVTPEAVVPPAAKAVEPVQPQ